MVATVDATVIHAVSCISAVLRCLVPHHLIALGATTINEEAVTRTGTVTTGGTRRTTETEIVTANGQVTVGADIVTIAVGAIAGAGAGVEATMATGIGTGGESEMTDDMFRVTGIDGILPSNLPGH